MHLSEPNITVSSLTPLCQKLCAQLVTCGMLFPNKAAKNEHLESDLLSSLALYPQLPQRHTVASLSDVVYATSYVFLELASRI